MNINHEVHSMLGYAALLQAKKGFIGSSQRDETIETSAGTTSSTHAWRNALRKAGPTQ